VRVWEKAPTYTPGGPEKDARSKSLIVKCLIKKVEIYKFVVLLKKTTSLLERDLEY